MSTIDTLIEQCRADIEARIGDDDDLYELVEQLQYLSRRSGLEQCAEIACNWCREGKPVKQNRETQQWHHYGDVVGVCQASEIWNAIPRIDLDTESLNRTLKLVYSDGSKS